jgi:uncharacterized membrane protein (UPF0127 family)
VWSPLSSPCLRRTPAGFRPGRVLALLCLLFAATGGCANQEPVVELNGRQFVVELAQTRAEQARGLMFREELEPEAGMLFVFSREAPRSFWMKNTRIPLDILYFDEQLALVGMALNARPCVADPCPAYPSGRPARYVLEINAGLGKELGVRPGDRLILHFDP